MSAPTGAHASAPTGDEVFCLVDGEGRVIYAAADLERVLGLQVDDVIGRRRSSPVHADDRVVTEDAWAQITRQPGVQVRTEFRVRDGGGSWRWVETVATNLLDAPAVGAVVVIVRDVTDRHEAEEALQASEALLRTVVRHTTDGLVLLDPHGRISWGNPALHEVLGYEPTAWIGHHILQFVHPDDVVSALPSLQRVIAGQSIEKPLVVRARHADGSWRWVEAFAKRVDDHDAVDGAMFSVRDVTDRLEAERAVRASEARLRAFLDNSPDLMLVVDFAGRITWISPRVTEMLGYDPDEVIGQLAWDLIDPDDLPATLDRFGDVLGGGDDAVPLVLHVLQRDGTRVPVEGLGTVLPGEDDAPDTVLVNVRDTRWRTEAEEALRRHDERFRALVQNSEDAVVVIGGDGEISYASPAATTIFGRPPGEDGTFSAFQFIHPDDEEQVRAEFLTVVTQPGASVTRQFRILRHPEGERWVEATIVNMLDNDAVGGLVANIRDITDRRAAEDALRASETRFRTVVHASYDVAAVVDRDATIQWVTENSVRLLGWRPEEVIGRNGFELVHPDDQDLMASELLAFTSGEGVPNPTTIKMRHKDGSWHFVEIVGSDLLDNPDIQGIALNLRGVDDRVAAERDRQRLTDIFGLTTDLVAIGAADGTTVYLNEAARQFFGIGSGDDVASFDLTERISDAGLDRIRTEALPTLESGVTWSGEFEVLRYDGEAVTVLGQMLAHRDADGEIEYVSGVMRDISERKAFERRLEHEATHDPLTGLPNRTLLLDRLDLALARSKRRGNGLAVLFCDLDHFKVVNDGMGHSVGDRLLVAVAERLRQQLRPGDTVSRFGGDEFVILCEDLDDVEDAISVAKRVDHALNQPFRLGEDDLHIGVSIGIALTEKGDGHPEALIRDADAAMYRAKAKGRNRYQVFEVDMWEQAVDRLDLERALRRALGRGELELHYQPIVDLRTGKVLAVEALMRWHHPDRGLLSPDQFMNVAEETGLIVPMGGWVLAEACRQLQAWKDVLPDLAVSVSVNLSARQLDHPDLVAVVDDALRASGLDGGRLHLEITESVLMEDVERSRHTLARLTELGVHVAVDDFGTGYSSLSSLRRFPVDRLKVDRSFVDGLGDEPEDTAIVAAIVNLAHTLGLQATAEGVETERQRHALEDLGCDSAQGYLLARPLAPDLVPVVLSGNGFSHH
ncbi:MAG: PAS domain S-box protein [Acidimicrobiales bacterium]